MRNGSCGPWGTRGSNLLARIYHRLTAYRTMSRHVSNVCCPQSVVFYLAMYNHIGFIDALGRLPWKALVYEGHEGDSLEELSGRLAEIKNVGSFSIKAAREYTDGDSGMRPIAILVRD